MDETFTVTSRSHANWPGFELVDVLDGLEGCVARDPAKKIPRINPHAPVILSLGIEDPSKARPPRRPFLRKEMARAGGRPGRCPRGALPPQRPQSAFLHCTVQPELIPPACTAPASVAASHRAITSPAVLASQVKFRSSTSSLQYATNLNAF